jgi:hypothetical protein
VRNLSATLLIAVEILVTSSERIYVLIQAKKLPSQDYVLYDPEKLFLDVEPHFTSLS